MCRNTHIFRISLPTAVAINNVLLQFTEILRRSLAKTGGGAKLFEIFVFVTHHDRALLRVRSTLAGLSRGPSNAR